MSTRLTPVQDRVWRFIADYALRYGTTPPARTIMLAHGWRSTNGTFGHLTALVRKGYGQWQAHANNEQRRFMLLRWPEVDVSSYGPGTHLHTLLSTYGEAWARAAGMETPGEDDDGTR